MSSALKNLTVDAILFFQDITIALFPLNPDAAKKLGYAAVFAVFAMAFDYHQLLNNLAKLMWSLFGLGVLAAVFGMLFTIVCYVWCKIATPDNDDVAAGFAALRG